MRTTFFQTNHEGEFCEYLHRLPDLADAAVVNAGAWTHYSWAIRDAIEVAAVPFVEVHISDVEGREDWRRDLGLRGSGAGQDLRPGRRTATGRRSSCSRRSSGA